MHESPTPQARLPGLRQSPSRLSVSPVMTGGYSGGLNSPENKREFLEESVHSSVSWSTFKYQTTLFFPEFTVKDFE